MTDKLRIDFEPIEGDSEACSSEQITMINQLADLIGLDDFDANDYELGKLQAEQLINDFLELAEVRMDAATNVKAKPGLGSVLWKAVLILTGIGVIISIFGDDGDE